MAKRRQEGKCGWEGCQELPGKAYYCLTHRRIRRDRMRKVRSGTYEYKRGPRVPR